MDQAISGPDRFPPGRDGVAALFDAVVELLAGPVLVLLEAVDEERTGAEQARRDRYEPRVD